MALIINDVHRKMEIQLLIRAPTSLTELQLVQGWLIASDR